ncbi:aminopeptidase P family protein [Halomonas sp. MCCC 1A11036]|uniref:Aminopeptidase P family protein n=1 Tax=Billgrantia zhangzhouensis TaxID=2733481 RepID=A0ABS9AFM4_9GAMM|nr:Xaa-Pro peptidase family protein [Halomonas zhangzhouensis]MCE8020525.1 aminopeptidase P family protein [Halomonas zhangzhouensis]
MTSAPELPFAPDHYKNAIESLQQSIESEGLQGMILFNPENIFWLTGYQTIGYFTFQAMFVPLRGYPVVISRAVNGSLARALPTIGEFVEIRDTDDPIDVLLAFFERERVRKVGIETSSWYLTVQDFHLMIGCSECDFVSWNGVLEKARIVKNEAQLDRVKRACIAARDGLVAAIDEIAPGKSENDVAAAMYDASIRSGSEYLGHPPLVVAGPRTSRCFSMWRRNKIRPGDVVLLESAGCVDRYHGMVSRSVVVGEPTLQQRQVAETLKAVLEKAEETVRPGVTAGEVDAACRRIVEEAGLAQYFMHRLGYGIGIGFPPNWAEGSIYSIKPRDPMVLEPGMTFHIVPTLFLPEFGMCFSDSFAVTENGCEVLTPYPRDLVVK